MKNISVKNDFLDHKLRWDLLPLEEVEDIVKVFTAGANKYGDNTWQHLENGYQRYKGAMLRHLVEYEKGNEIDEETGCRHLAQVAWNAISMLYLSKRKEIKKPEPTDILKDYVPYSNSNLNSSGYNADSSITFTTASTIEGKISKLDERIKERIDNCNKMLDELVESKPNKEVYNDCKSDIAIEESIVDHNKGSKLNLPIKDEDGILEDFLIEMNNHLKKETEGKCNISWGRSKNGEYCSDKLFSVSINIVEDKYNSFTHKHYTRLDEMSEIELNEIFPSQLKRDVNHLIEIYKHLK